LKKVLLLLADGFEIYEASAFIDVIGWNLAEGDGTTQLFSCGLRKEIKSSFNQRFIVDILIDEIDIDDYEALVIPGGFEVYGYYKDAYCERFLNLIRGFYEKNKLIASICVWALPLGKSGILNGKKATTYQSKVWQDELKGFGVEVLKQPIVVDGKIISSQNPSTAIPVALLLLEMLSSKIIADKISKLMGFREIYYSQSVTKPTPKKSQASL
jgi:protein deglycase